VKILGQKPKGPRVEVLVLPYEGFDIEVRAQAVLNPDDFQKACKEPIPPILQRPGKDPEPDLKDKAYLAAKQRYNELSVAWLMITSLQVTKDLEWETVDPLIPDTWLKWKDELREGGFTNHEINLIQNTVWAANGLNQDKLDEARERFLAGRLRRPETQQSPTGEQQTSPSGEPVNASE
jgi:hypothetical protein